MNAMAALRQGLVNVQPITVGNMQLHASSNSSNPSLRVIKSRVRATVPQDSGYGAAGFE